MDAHLCGCCADLPTTAQLRSTPSPGPIDRAGKGEAGESPVTAYYARL